VGKAEAIFIHVRSYQKPCSQYHDEKVHIHGGIRWCVMQVFSAQIHTHAANSKIILGDYLKFIRLLNRNKNEKQGNEREKIGKKPDRKKNCDDNTKAI
jgi:hypothetical protein